MTDKITYYALIDDFSDRAAPGGVLRRVEGDRGKVDQVFSRDLAWNSTPLLHAAERGDTMYEFTEITEAEAATIVERIKAEAADQK